MCYAKTLCIWYVANKREMPWRNTSDPYRIWVSEAMLQQTQVDTVIPYYDRFIERFPTVFSLAGASLEEVFAVWQGLGYYKRAENLYKGANVIVSQFGGLFPNDIQSVMQIPGVGAYTAGAILSIAFNQPIPAVDGNVMRVISRQFLISDDISLPKSKSLFEELVLTLITEEPRVFNQALMELGALICTPQSPKCADCPMQSQCLAFQMNLVQAYPVKTKKTRPIVEHYEVLLCKQGGGYWMEKRPQDGLLAGLWGFPMLTESIIKTLGKDIKVTKLKPVRHVFTHRVWEMQPSIIDLDEQDIKLPDTIMFAKDGQFVSCELMVQLPIATAFRRIIIQIGHAS